ncbi:WUSCHEL-related homeobox 9 isoform X1 [Morus notabilis]|uniref:WUSCHEL-related homeobox 9 isoform X1 n=1 Tax=Morus notabilis TaxID=981085 RepID=UPI000CED7574|nr:WUSCHEL-related homeobox 9 isoform X1 [Morus notabilis]
MASSNRHWPSLFKSKPCNSHHQWQHDINQSLISNGCHRAPYTSVTGCEERSPEPKPRWNPKPEQIRILEAIFNSGMVNPPRDEIRKIRAQLQEYGQVGDANVFYWFQNRKSRSKHKLRHLQNSKQQQQQQNIHQILPNNSNNITTINTTTTTTTTIAPSSSSSSSSEKSSPKAPNRPAFSMGFSEALNSPTASVNQSTFFQTNSSTHDQFLAEPFLFQSSSSQGFCFPELMPNGVHNFVPLDHYTQQHNNIGPCTSLLLSEIMNHHGASKKLIGHDHNINAQEAGNKLQQNYAPAAVVAASTSPAITALTTAANSTTTRSVTSGNQIQAAVGEQGSVSGVGPAVGCGKTTVFINDVAFEVPAGPFSVREAFGVEAVLIHSNGQPVLTNEWGVTLHSLHHGAFYYLI